VAHSTDQDAAQAIAAAAWPLHGQPDDHDRLLDLIGDARFVLLGEATHGTHEFYAERARITQRLVREKGFGAVAVEADWPDAWRVNCYARGSSRAAGAVQALEGFQRFPGWMWRNTDVSAFADWLRDHNAALPAATQVGFYGLDLYSLFTSIGEVLRYLDKVDPDAAHKARARYACFDHYSEDGQAYAYAAGTGSGASCEAGVVRQLQDMQQRAADYLRHPDIASPGDAYFYAQQNAQLVKNAEAYYRTMLRGRVSSWNLRDRHMADMLDALALHLGEQRGAPARIVVWAHNSHLGDARATEMGAQGEWNVGQLTRQSHPRDTCLIGFTTYEGTVTAASQWDGEAECKRLLPALPGSVEALLHTALPGNYCLPLRDHAVLADALAGRRLERAVGVLYLPATERHSHYFHAILPAQFDAVIHIDKTSAVVALPGIDAHGGDLAETFPSGV
jgi:erythromycin esterase-like protein